MTLRDKIASIASGNDYLWAIAFVGVAVLVGLEKIKPETLEYLLFALAGKASLKSRALNPSPTNEQ
jgi:hypothetical protein